MQALSVKNGDGETALHIVARATKHGHKILKFLVKSIGSSDLLKLKNEKGLTVLNIVSECYPGHDKDLIVEEEGRKQLDPADFPGTKYCNCKICRLKGVIICRGQEIREKAY